MFPNLDISAFVPPIYNDWQPLLVDGLQEFVRRLPADRQVEITHRQLCLANSTTVSARLVELLCCSPVLHKLGQVVARRRELSPELRQQLCGLESKACEIPLVSLLPHIRGLLGDAISNFQMTFEHRVLAEGSVAYVIPFTWCGAERPQRS